MWCASICLRKEINIIFVYDDDDARKVIWQSVVFAYDDDDKIDVDGDDIYVDGDDDYVGDYDDYNGVACLHLVMQGKQSGGNFADEIEPGTVANT